MISAENVDVQTIINCSNHRSVRWINKRVSQPVVPLHSARMYRQLSKLCGLLLVVGTILWCPPVALADVCVTIDTNRDTLTQSERTAVVGVITEALETEGVGVDSSGLRCDQMVVAYAIRLGRRVTATVSAAGEKRTGAASSMDELDLLFRQLIRGLVLGEPIATGGGAVQRNTVLLDQTAPRRVDARDSRYWDRVFAIGGGMLQLPANRGEPLHRQYNIIVAEVRARGFLTQRLSGIEFMGRAVIHDYRFYDKVYDLPQSTPKQQQKRRRRIAAAWLAVPSYDFGFGLVHFFGQKGGVRPFVRGGATISVLMRLSDTPGFVDVGIGGYAGLGLQLTEHVGFSVATSIANPVVHSFGDTGYSYFGTATASLEFSWKRKRPMSGLLGQILRP